MSNMVSLNELQIVVSRFDTSAKVGDLVFEGFSYSDKKDFYKMYMYDVRRAKRYIVAFKHGRYIAVIEK